MYKFGQIKIASKEFNSVNQIQKDVDLEKIRVSEGVVANKHDARYTVGYEVKSGKIVPLCIKTPKRQKTVYLREFLCTTRAHRGRWAST